MNEGKNPKEGGAKRPEGGGEEVASLP